MIGGKVTEIDNRRLANVAKLAGAPMIKEAGVELLGAGWIHSRER